MKTTKYITSMAAIMAAAILPASAAINFNFAGGAGGLDDGFLGESGQTSGITYGLIFDTAGDGFDTSYTGLTLSSSISAAGVVMGGSDDDTFIYGGTTQANFLGNSLLADVNGVDGTYETDSFRVIWFDSSISGGSTASAGNTYGLSSIDTAPLNGNTNPYDISPVSANAGSLTFVPEPSAALLGAFGGLLLLRRRRSA